MLELINKLTDKLTNEDLKSLVGYIAVVSSLQELRYQSLLKLKKIKLDDVTLCDDKVLGAVLINSVDDCLKSSEAAEKVLTEVSSKVFKDLDKLSKGD